MKTLLMICLIVSAFLFSALNISGQEVFIDEIKVNSNYNSSYLTSYSSVYLFQIKYVNRNQIQRVVREFETSGVYKRVDWTLLRDAKAESSRLILTPIYPSDYESFVLDNIVLDKISDVEAAKVKQRLMDKGVSFGSPWYKNSYRDLVSKISSALGELAISDSAKRDAKSPWISVRCFRSKRVTLVVHGSSFDFLGLVN